MSQKELKTTEAQRRAALKWERENNEKVTIKFRKNGIDGFTKADLQNEAKSEGKSLNTWLIDLIREKLRNKRL